MSLMDLLSQCTGFDWDEGNLPKIWERHEVSALECEQVFFSQPLVVAPDGKHSDSEPRFYALGHTGAGRSLFVVFTIRGKLIRVVSARDMNRRERGIYERS